MRSQRYRWARPLSAGIAVLAAVPGVARAQVPQDDPRRPPEVKALVLRGVTSVDKLDLLRSIATQATACKNILLEPFCLFTHSPTFVDRSYLDPEEFRRDVLRIRVYYWRRGFRDAQVDTSVTPRGARGVTVTFSVHENRPTLIQHLVIADDSALLTAKQRRQDALIHAGRPLDLVALDSTRTLMRGDLWRQGYSDAEIDTSVVLDSSGSLADVALHVVPHPKTVVGPITVTGLKRVDTSTVLHAITLRTGALFRKGQDLESQRNLYESSLFRLVQVRVPEQPDSVKPVDITVAEAPLHEVQLGGGINSVDFLQAQGTYTSFNLFGGARRLSLTGTIGNLLAPLLAGDHLFYNPADYVAGGDASEYLSPTWETSADLTQPAFLSQPANNAGFGVFAHRRTDPGIFVDNGYGATSTFTRTIEPRTPVSITYRYEINRVDAGDVYFCVDYGVCDSVTINALRSRQTLSPLVLSTTIDRSDVPLDPTQGYIARLNLESASSLTLSNYHYNRALFDVATYTRFGTNVLSAHLRLGIVRAIGAGLNDSGAVSVLQPRTRFYAGGATSVRGYADNQLGPKVLTISPDQLANTTTASGAPCDITGSAIQQCNPNTGGLSDGAFAPQALGGTSLIEASVEWRFPVPIYQNKVVGAVFLDGAVVGQSSVQVPQALRSIVNSASAITPGFGLRYKSSVGPIRLDIGINPERTEQLGVVTSIVQNGVEKIIPLMIPRTYHPGGTTLLDRLTLNFSIGEAY